MGEVQVALKDTATVQALLTQSSFFSPFSLLPFFFPNFDTA
eukprot:NODE_13664_length_205_cov_6.557692_g11894_i0.p2 GENE.NODE_13664_length_205_cov_6.557692_g11894_i0~~NODE_13664_length_205_cov_6.557692_g11894_i0.p2  ORF type:complete len:51 (-),score=30.54 NODE_13664_length_205_cov_6.557692_g11894_i0:53-175(-)